MHFKHLNLLQHPLVSNNWAFVAPLWPPSLPKLQWSMVVLAVGATHFDDKDRLTMLTTNEITSITATAGMLLTFVDPLALEQLTESLSFLFSSAPLKRPLEAPP